MASHLRPQGTEPSDDEAFIFSLIGKIQKYDQYIAKNLDQDTLGSLKKYAFGQIHLAQKLKFSKLSSLKRGAGNEIKRRLLGTSIYWL